MFYPKFYDSSQNNLLNDTHYLYKTNIIFFHFWGDGTKIQDYLTFPCVLIYVIHFSECQFL